MQFYNPVDLIFGIGVRKKLIEQCLDKTVLLVSSKSALERYSNDPIMGEFFWGGAASTIFWVDKKNNVTATMMTQYMPSDKYPLREELKTLLYSGLSN